MYSVELVVYIVGIFIIGNTALIIGFAMVIEKKEAATLKENMDEDFVPSKFVPTISSIDENGSVTYYDDDIIIEE